MNTASGYVKVVINTRTGVDTTDFDSEVLSIECLCEETSEDLVEWFEREAKEVWNDHSKALLADIAPLPVVSAFFSLMLQMVVTSDSEGSEVRLLSTTPLSEEDCAGMLHACDTPRSTLEFQSLRDLVEEVIRRTEACAIAYLHYEEGAEDASEVSSTSIVEGNFVMVDGLVRLLQHRADSKRSTVIEHKSKRWEDE